jgi:hypothetical protein
MAWYSVIWWLWSSVETDAPQGEALLRLCHSGLRLFARVEVIRPDVAIHDLIQGPGTEPGHETLRGVEGHQPHGIEEGHPVSQEFRFLDVVRGEEDGRAVGPRHLDEGPDAAPDARVEAYGGLVEEEDPGAVHEGSGDHHASLHPARKLSNERIPAIAEVDVFQKLLDSPPPVVSVHAEKTPVDIQVFGEAHTSQGLNALVTFLELTNTDHEFLFRSSRRALPTPIPQTKRPRKSRRHVVPETFVAFD